jgi:hypothetical protein
MTTRATPAIGRWAVVAGMVLAGAVDAAAQLPGDRISGEPNHAEFRQILPPRPLFPHFGLAVLQDIKQLERRPEGPPGEWVQPLLRWQTWAARWPAPVAAYEVIQGREGSPLSEDEREVRRGGVQRRLIDLAITGRIAKEEYDGLVKRLRGD